MTRCMVVASLALLAACGGEDPLDGDKLGLAAEALELEERNSGWQTVYTSGNTNNLSPWQGLDCNANGETERALFSLRGRRERASNLDRFVAGLDARCRQYIGLPGLYRPGAADDFVQLFDRPATRDQRTTTVPFEANRIAVGLRLNLNSGRAYVRNIQLRHTRLTTGGLHTTIQRTDPGVTTLTGNQNVAGICRDNEALTGIRVRASMNNGKIRRVQMRCTDVVE